MTEDATAYIPLWALLFTALGLMLGWVLGDEVRRRMNAEEKVDELRDRLESAAQETPVQNRQLKEMRGVLNDIHKLVRGVTKALEKPAP
jgi:hypothetical protein